MKSANHWRRSRIHAHSGQFPHSSCPSRAAHGVRVLLGQLLLSFGYFASTLAASTEAAEQSNSTRNSGRPASRLIEGMVSAIIDGDTLHLDSADAAYVVDLAGIDAPEKGQASGDMAAQALYLKVFHHQVTVFLLPEPPADPIVSRITPEPVGAEPPGRSPSSPPVRRRVCGILYSQSCVNTELVREGLAWHDSKNCPSKALSRAQETARKGLLGLWQDVREPIPPWQWRQQQVAATPGLGPAAQPRPQAEDLSRRFVAPPTAAIEAAAQGQPATARTSAPALSGTTPGTRYWLTGSSSIRHNSDCRYYQKSKGRPCQANEGRPCKVCGG